LIDLTCLVLCKALQRKRKLRKNKVKYNIRLELDLVCDPVQVAYDTKRPTNVNNIESYTSFYLHDGRINRGEEWDKNSQIDFDPLITAAVDDTTSPYEAYDDSEDEKKLERETGAAFHIGSLLTRMRYYMLVSNLDFAL
jgi:hypothetical protein